MLEIPERIWKAIKGYTKPQKVFRTNSEHILCWKTTRLEDKKYVVIKLFDWEVTEQIKSESKAINAIKKINHKNLVRVYDIKEDEELGLYYVMECWGEDLRESFKYLPRQEQTIDIIKQVLEGLSELHKKVGAHRDIKPENIFIKGGAVKIGDYGLVKSKRFVTELTTIAGTHGYMAPEVLSGKPYDERCDIYSVGIVLLELLTGSREITNNKSESTSNKLWKVVLQATSKELNIRFSLVQDFVTALNNLTGDILNDDIVVLKKPKPVHIKSNRIVKSVSSKQPCKLKVVTTKKEPINLRLGFLCRDIELENPGLLIQNLQKQFEQLQRNHNIIETIKVGEELALLVRNQFGNDNPYVAEIWATLAELYTQRRDYQKAESLYIGARGIYIRKYSENSEENIVTLIRLAELYHAKKDYLLSISRWQDALSIIDRVMWQHKGGFILFVSINKHQLGVLHYLLEKYAIAIKYYKEALGLTENIDEFSLSINLYNLALTYEAQGNKSAAEPLYKQALEIAEKTMKPDDERLKIIKLCHQK